MIRKTKSGLPKNCCWYVDQHGKSRVRFRKKGFSTYLTGTPWSEGFMRQYAAALDGVTGMATNAGSSRTKPGSMNALIANYYRSTDFNNLKLSTQRHRRSVLERFRRDHGDKPIRSLTRAHVNAIIGARADTPESANYLLKTLRGILEYAVTNEMIDVNPAAGVKMYKSRGEGFHAWTEEEIAKFQLRHLPGTRPYLALALLLYTAQRRSDVVRMGWQHVRADTIT